MTVYSDNGVILGSSLPERTGKTLLDADGLIYGDNIRPAYDAVTEGKYYNFRSYVPFLENDVEINIITFSIGTGNWEGDTFKVGSGNWHDTSWAIMIASPVKYWIPEKTSKSEK